MWHQKAKGPPDGPPVFLIFVEKLNCPQSQAYQSISPVGTGLSLTDRALGVSLGTSIGNYSPLIAPQPVKLKIHRWRHRAGSSPATGTSGKLPLPSRAPHVVGCVFFFAALVAGSYFVISARSALRASRELHLCGVRSFFARVSHWRLFCLLNPG